MMKKEKKIDGLADDVDEEDIEYNKRRKLEDERQQCKNKLNERANIIFRAYKLGVIR